MPLWFLLPLAFLFALSLIVRTPSVFLLPLSLVNTPTFDGALLAFRFFGTLAFVSTTPLRVALPLPLLAFELVAFESPPPQAVPQEATASRESKLSVRRIFPPSRSKPCPTARPIGRP